MIRKRDPAAMSERRSGDVRGALSTGGAREQIETIGKGSASPNRKSRRRAIASTPASRETRTWLTHRSR